MTITYRVSGMNCQHCVNAVTEEISALDGVQAVNIDLVENGVSAVHVDSARELDRTAVAEAVDEAGYELVEG